MKRVAVVTPIYKQKLSQSENMALHHGFQVLSAYDRIFVSPRNLEYLDTLLPDKTLYFDEHYFKNIAGYNRLMLSEKFYECFLEYEYILIFQPDAFVFRDELLQWCEKGYAYIGAPWPQGRRLYPYGFSGVDYIGKYLPFFIRNRSVFVGNGGFSLRHVETAIEMLKKHPFIVRSWTGNEDAFWSYYAAMPENHFPVPDEKEASKFALELDAEKYYIANERLLPFACHGWEKYSVEFWQKIIAQQVAELELNNNS